MKRDEQISAMVERLIEFRAAERGERLRDILLRWIEDPLEPKTKEGKSRVNPVLLLLAAMALVAAGTFVFFSLVQL